MSCYEVVSNHTRYVSERLLVEEDDLFKFNCQEILPDDFISLQVVVSPDDFIDLENLKVEYNEESIN